MPGVPVEGRDLPKRKTRALGTHRIFQRPGFAHTGEDFTDMPTVADRVPASETDPFSLRALLRFASFAPTPERPFRSRNNRCSVRLCFRPFSGGKITLARPLLKDARHSSAKSKPQSREIKQTTKPTTV